VTLLSIPGILGLFAHIAQCWVLLAHVVVCCAWYLYIPPTFKKRMYNNSVMSIESWIGIIVGISTIITSTGLGVRWLVRHYFAEIKSELKPNSGSSIKDQVTRLESQHEKLEQKIDRLYDTLLEHMARNK
jgi:hypothetical protein